ncbi:MAG: DUF222 domain-containing protein, partial [Enhygromyxa sp.]
MAESTVSPERLSPAALESLGDEIATFAARIDVAEHALLTRLRLFDAQEGWGRCGAISCAQWLSWRTGIGPKAAREKVRVARALGGLPKLDALFACGELSYSKARAITRVATAQTEQHFIDIAVHATAAQIERLARAYRRVHSEQGEGEPPLDQRRFMRRTETWSGMVRLEIQLPPEEAAIVWSAVMSALDHEAFAEASGVADSAGEASAEALGDADSVGEEASAEASGPASTEGAAADKDASVETSTADTADKASAEASAQPWQPTPTRLAKQLWGDSPPQPSTFAGLPSTANTPAKINDETLEARRADALVDLARAYLQHHPRTLGSGYEMVVVTTPALLEQ